MWSNAEDEVTDLETDVDFLFDEQIIQDEKLLNLEQKTEVNMTTLSCSLIFHLQKLGRTQQ